MVSDEKRLSTRKLMTGRIDYQIEKYHFTAIDEAPRLTRQWEEVLEECRQEKAGSESRLRIALLNVDYVTSFELPFRLLLVRAPQLIDKLRGEFALNQKNAVINTSKRGCVYSLNEDFQTVPDEFRYRFSHRIRRVAEDGVTAAPFQQVAAQSKLPRERLRLALEAGLAVNALDGLFWLSCQRIAAEVATLRTSGLTIVTGEVEVSDSLTGTTRQVPVYRLARPA
jgi:hypothetical protein